MKLMSWPDFKKEIYNIYDHRVENAPEINGLINNTYMTLDEHLLLYICTQGITEDRRKKNEDTREDIENRMMDFMYSLKYYCQRWPRAKMFAKMLGFLLDEKINLFSELGKPS